MGFERILENLDRPLFPARVAGEQQQCRGAGGTGYGHLPGLSLLPGHLQGLLACPTRLARLRAQRDQCDRPRALWGQGPGGTCGRARLSASPKLTVTSGAETYTRGINQSPLKCLLLSEEERGD